jgi:siroheme synthase (precorrin-2 oxidase/ferrochelatase)
MTSQYPEIQGGGSLILAWQIRNRHVLVIGGGEVSARHGAPLQALRLMMHGRLLQAVS